MEKLTTREELFPSTFEIVNNIFNDFNNGLKHEKYQTISLIKRSAPNVWNVMSDKQKTRLYRTAKKHHKL